MGLQQPDSCCPGFSACLHDKQPLISAAGTIYLLFLSLLQLIVYAAPACITCFLATVGIRSSTPPTPPSASAVSSSSEPFLQGMKQVRRLGKITENLAAPRKPNIARWWTSLQLLCLNLLIITFTKPIQMSSAPKDLVFLLCHQLSRWTLCDVFRRDPPVTNGWIAGGTWSELLL